MKREKILAIDVIDADERVIFRDPELLRDEASLAGRAVYLRVDLGLKPEFKMKKVELTEKEFGARQLLNMPLGGVC